MRRAKVIYIEKTKKSKGGFKTDIVSQVVEIEKNERTNEENGANESYRSSQQQLVGGGLPPGFFVIKKRCIAVNSYSFMS